MATERHKIYIEKTNIWLVKWIKLVRVFSWSFTELHKRGRYFIKTYTSGEMWKSIEDLIEFHCFGLFATFSQLNSTYLRFFWGHLNF